MAKIKKKRWLLIVQPVANDTYPNPYGLLVPEYANFDTIPDELFLNTSYDGHVEDSWYTGWTSCRPGNLIDRILIEETVGCTISGYRPFGYNWILSLRLDSSIYNVDVICSNIPFAKLLDAGLSKHVNVKLIHDFNEGVRISKVVEDV